MNYEFIKSLLFKLDAELAHNIAMSALAVHSKFCRIAKSPQFSELAFSALGSEFASPFGLAAGLDKNAVALKSLASMGFGYLEVGAITPLAQLGNPRPRLWRLIDERSLQNAMGFNNLGAKKIAKNLRLARYSGALPAIWANIGKNKLTPNEQAVDDYLSCVSELEALVDAFVINISSPNTPGLRELAQPEFIARLFKALSAQTAKPLVMKFSPDSTNKLILESASAALNNGAKALIISNTTQDYSLSKNAKNIGGISGALLAPRAKELLKLVAREFGSDCKIISCGGIASAQDGLERIKLGAHMLQGLSGFIYAGPSWARQLNAELAALVKEAGCAHFSELIGVDL